MRLLHTTRLEMEEFFDYQIPKYAILSHRWEEDEVSYEDWLAKRKWNGAGYKKIRSCCRLAASAGYEWVWIDTCCIDKRSSADLSEAINSMFRWYENSKICYAYLSDVRGKREAEGFGGQMAYFRESAWFTRGWTLQELLAPDNVVFLDRNWTTIGHKKTLISHISETTGICEQYIGKSYPISWASVAERMSWASGRMTSRLEDKAYCLLGIFDINIPLLYGEGEKAFRRLQMEIIKESNDESIFAWEADGPDVSPGMLALSPSRFQKSAKFQDSSVKVSQKIPYAITNRGLQFHGYLIARPSNHLHLIKYWLLLNCFSGRKRIGIPISVFIPMSDREVPFDRLRFYRDVHSGLQEFDPSELPPAKDWAKGLPAKYIETRIYLDIWGKKEDIFNQAEHYWLAG